MAAEVETDILEDVATKYQLEAACQVIMRTFDIEPDDVLRRAELPRDLFSHPRPMVDAAGFFRLWDAIAELAIVEDYGFEAGRLLSLEYFSPLIFALTCSTNLSSAARRAQTYNLLLAPIRLEIEEDNQA